MWGTAVSHIFVGFDNTWCVYTHSMLLYQCSAAFEVQFKRGACDVRGLWGLECSVGTYASLDSMAFVYPIVVAVEVQQLFQLGLNNGL